ncbi:MAG: cation:proton antiporter, partial [Candidatus Aenigmarchaeota archaeon]|nr:cation:proton antiporter [Candidatus Aenigmarchaeota archaeon]
NIGITVLMYIAGLEIDFDFMKSKLSPCLYMGLSSFFIPFGLIYLFCYFPYNIPHLTSLIISLALSTTSVAIAFTVLSSKGKLNEEKKTILSAVMVIDVMSMIFLGFFSSAFSYFTLLFLILMVVLTYFFPYLGKRIFKKREKTTIELELKFVLFSLLCLSFMSEHAGLEPALIAFFFGALTSEFIVGHIELQKQLNGIAFGFLTPIFFFVTGTKINVLLAFENLYFLIFLFLIAFSSKYYSALFAIKKYFRKNASYYAKLFSAQLTFGLIAITFGLQKGILDEKLFSVIGLIIILCSSIGFFAKEK